MHLLFMFGLCLVIFVAGASLISTAAGEENNPHPITPNLWGTIMITTVLIFAYHVFVQAGMLVQNKEVIYSIILAGVFGMLGFMLWYNASQGQTVGFGTRFQFRLVLKFLCAVICFLAVLSSLSEAIRHL